MEFLVKNEVHTETGWRLRCDLLIRGGGLVGVTDIHPGPTFSVAETTITIQRENGDIDLVALLQQSVPIEETRALEYLQSQWPHLQAAFENSEASLGLKEAIRPLQQADITRLAHFHLTNHRLDLIKDKGVLPKTARAWRLLQQFGSFRPAEVIADLLQEKVSTIHARIRLARAQGLIPPADRKINENNKNGERNECD